MAFIKHKYKLYDKVRVKFEDEYVNGTINELYNGRVYIISLNSKGKTQEAICDESTVELYNW